MPDTSLFQRLRERKLVQWALAYLAGAFVVFQAVEGEGRPSTIPDEPFEAFPVGGLDADAPIEAKTAAVIPGEHILGFVGFQKAVALKMPQYSLSQGML
jgi:hypothetical protein